MLLVASEMHFKQNSSFGWPGLNHDTVGAIDSIQANQMKNFPLKYLLDHFWKPLAKRIDLILSVSKVTSSRISRFLRQIAIWLHSVSLILIWHPNPAKPTIYNPFLMNFKASCLSALLNWHWLSSFPPLSWTYFVSRKQAFLPIFPSPLKLLLCCPFIQDIITGSKKADYKRNYFWHSQSTGIFGFSWICPIFATRGALGNLSIYWSA